MALIDDVSTMAEIDLLSHANYLDTMIPILKEFADDYCSRTFDNEALPAGVKLFIAESIKYKLNNKKGLKSLAMGTVTYSYDTELPNTVTKHLKPYRKVRFN